MNIAIIEGKKHQQDLIKILVSQFNIVKLNEKPELIIVLGGDGTMVDAIKSNYQLNIPFYGINQGTEGFLLNNHETTDTFADFFSEAIATKFIMLQAEIEFFDNQPNVTIQAFNDVWTKCFSTTGQSSKIKIFVDDKNVVANGNYDYLIGDGIIICSPGGSTAYNNSAGGIIIDPNLEALGLTAICPYKPAFKPQLISNEQTIKFEIVEADKRPTMVFADGQGFENVRKVTVKKSPHSTCILFRKDVPYARKIHRVKYPYQ